jgi:nucleoside-diphosphate-sugar epimerase
MSVEMTKQASPASQILVTGAAGAVGSIGRNLTEMLLAKGHKVRALGSEPNCFLASARRDRIQAP